MRRPNGTGTIVKLSGNRRRPYVVRISSRDARGYVIQKSLSYHTSAKEAQAALDDYNAKQSTGTAVAPSALSVTLGDIYAAWSKRKYSRSGVASVASYTASWKRLSVLREMKVRDITIDHLQAIIDQGEQAGLSKSSINNDKLLMKALYAHAMERDIAVKDTSSFVRLPQVEAKHEKGSFTDLQLKRLEELAESGFPWADTALMLCYTGFRITEFLTLTRFSYHRDGDYFQWGMKTAAGKGRIVPVHLKIKPYLERWLSKGGDTIICKGNGRPILSPWYRDTPFAAIAKELGAPQATPHWCRHTFATRLHASGVPELEKKRLMGHASKDVTEHYTHTDIDQLSAAIRRLA